MKNRFPLYIPTKGRADSRYTSRALDFMRVEHFLVVEEQELEHYAQAIVDWERETGLRSYAKLLQLDMRFKHDYELLDEHGLTRSTGPGPARNFAWEHSISQGYDWHWVMDDNIKNFVRLHDNLKIKMGDGTCFRVMEDFCLRYKNVTMAGPNYNFFAKQNQKLPPYIKNTRIYSCNLIRNDCGFRWRGRYNEDTILSLDMLTAGYCTIQFNAFLQGKMKTQVLGGGNSEEFYFKEGTAPKSRMLKEAYPEYTELVWKFGREHHHVDYRPFKKTPLIRVDDYDISSEANNYGMTMKKLPENTPGRV